MKMGVKKGNPMMWSQWVWERKSLVFMGPLGRSRLRREPASSLIPEPASMIIRRSSGSRRTSMQAVFPPYFMVLGPGQGIEPRTPQNVTRIAMMSRSLRDNGEEDLGLFDFLAHRILKRFQV